MSPLPHVGLLARRIAVAAGTLSALCMSIPALSAGAAPRIGIVCNDNGSVARVAPSTCTILPPSASFSEGVALVKMRWRGWGSKVATGTGLDTGFHLPLEHIPVAVAAFDLVACPDGTSVYTSLRVSSKFGTSTVRAQRCATGPLKFTKCPLTHRVGVDYLRVRGASCGVGRQIAEAGPAKAKKWGVTCKKTGESPGYTAWKCVGGGVSLTFRFYGDD